MGRSPRDSTPPTLTLKLCLAGDFAVGKSSLVRRFVSDTFSDDYIATLGAKVSSKQFSVSDPTRSEGTREVRATVWDLMGQRGFRELLQDAFFLNAGGVLLVADATRPETLLSLAQWAASVVSVAGDVPMILLLNKTDLDGQVRLSVEEVDRFCADRGWSWIATSAKMGVGVEDAFRALGEAYLRGLLASPSVPRPTSA